MVYKCDSFPWGLSTGWILNHLEKLPLEHLAHISKKKFDFLLLSLFPQKYQRTGKLQDFIEQGFIKSDCALESRSLNQIGIRLSDYDLAIPDKTQRKFFRDLVKQEFEYASYLGVSIVVLKVSISSDLDKIVKRYVKFLKSVCNTQNEQLNLWLEFDVARNEGGLDPWLVYNAIRIQFKRNFKVSLRISPNLPNKNDQRRWLAENIHNIVIPTDIFKMNDKGVPVLENNVEQFIATLFKYECKVSFQALHHKMDLTEYRNYLIFLFKNQPKPSELECIAQDYDDELQEPLQPYRDNLHSYTYQVFEQDPEKYEYYQRAIVRYFEEQNQNSQKQFEIQFYKQVLAGAGRGGIMFRIAEASRLTKTNIILYAIEKNPYAYLTLLHHQKHNGIMKNIKLEIVLADLKTYQPDFKADLIVSELLGSFGDNELSPECLGWAQRFLKPDGVSIPQSSTSYLVPVSCPTVHVKVRNQKGIQGFHRSMVVRMRRYFVNGTIQPCFHFTHPETIGNYNVNKVKDYHDFKTINFEIKQDQLLHGLIGYFDATLYSTVVLSIHPMHHTPNMYSWFEIYFPFETPVMCYKGQHLEIKMMRLNDEAKVWYEWSGNLFNGETLVQEIPVHNKGGQCQAIHII